MTFSVKQRVVSMGFAVRGLKVMLHSQHNAWVHAAATVAVVVVGAALGLARWEWVALVLAIVSVWTAESLNTALEFLCDMTSPEYHPLIEKAKDVAAGAVLLAACGAAVVGVIVFVPHLPWPGTA